MTTSNITRVRAFLNRETTGGVLVLIGAVVGLALANAPTGSAFRAFSQTVAGPGSIGLDLSVGEWAQDGLLAVFFFTVGLELISEIRVGSLHDPRKAAVPILAACGGVAVPAIIYTAVIVATSSTQYLHGWAIPTATDIAFSLAVLVIAGRGLPSGLRVFLLTLAVVDDLIGILVIAIFYSHGLNLLALLGAGAAVAVFAWLVRRPRMRWWLLIPVALIAWWSMHASGVHATIAGVALGLVVPAVRRAPEMASRATRLGQLVQPLSNVIALPVFAIFAAGVPISLTGSDGEAGLFAHPLVWAVTAALVIGKPVGIMLTSAALARWTGLRLPDAVGLRDLLPVGLLCGIGFTVSMLIAGLSFPDSTAIDEARAAILVGSLIAAILGAVVLRHDSRSARGPDMNEDGIPDQDIRPI
ncbi:Na+/H+ antiporter NhaA [Acidipropionibacterium virtanenii]|uniref:Na(+)/H(+) antiporter NhaA n=1 Tax=Acidipropionibacterium virtanenii TaxID=2057246 RepID=A0A344UY76_9ACTN|nr:Na+/H+ antiporter NhaA [Acidipropionibacterium virtanenii]AXE40224.1 Na(+)/H(+) antiporter NhaA [Acidipropionibacterium virtanenii]